MNTSKSKGPKPLCQSQPQKSAFRLQLNLKSAIVFLVATNNHENDVKKLKSWKCIFKTRLLLDDNILIVTLVSVCWHLEIIIIINCRSPNGA